MPVHIILATTPQQYDEAFKLRHRVFVEEENLLHPNPDARIVDRFDAFPSTKILLMYADDRIIGSVRVTQDSEVGIPADAYFDFRQHAPADANLVHVGMLCIEQAFRSTRLVVGILQMAGYIAYSEKATHVAAPINPAIARLTRRIGFRVVGEPVTEPAINVPMTPLLLTISEAQRSFMDFAIHNQLPGFLEDYERSFYEKGEYVIRAGEQGQHAYIIVSGSATVTLPDSEEAIGTLGEGELFGELALITEETRSLNVIAASNLVLMRLSAETFRRYFYHQPEKVETVLKLLGRRTRGLIGQLQTTLTQT